MTAIILAGGKSSRMGRDKAFIEVGGVPLIKRQLKLLKSLFKKVIIVANSQHNYRLKGVKVIQDIIPGQGPLGGIYSGLRASTSFYNFVVACDAPFLNLELIKYMVSLKDGFDVVIPKAKRGYEPLFAVYSKNCTLPIYEIINPALRPGEASGESGKGTVKTGNLRVASFFNQVKLKELNQEEISKFGSPSILFMNINTKDDLVRLEKGERIGGQP